MFKKIKPLFFTACMGILGAVALQFSLSVQAAHAIPPACEDNACNLGNGCYYAGGSNLSCEIKEDKCIQTACE